VTPALRCPSCGSLADGTSPTCPTCDTPLPWHDGETRLAPNARGEEDARVDADPDLTRLADPAKPALRDTSRPSGKTPSGGHARSSRSGSSGSWLSSSGAIDHGRFEPGALLDDRYRIVGRLGKGGMGEVYRADDLKLGQQVALKFLPESVDRDPARLTQLHTEVRMARQVSHPNVCRVYDAGEYDGHTFLSMEYVDGEDLASLIRRVGRFPQDRAIELARQICAGLAAAHDRGVVHRDLKPANIMLDGSGKIRITDFGLAGATGEVLRAGTPAYMAPEQLAGGEVTARSDVYALGLVLYELFTGRRALDAASMAELIAKREQADITLPTDIVRDLDAGIERVIMRCLEPDPARRPGSALGVAAALPGGDPLAAALAAGETPSPDMVAASGTTEALPRTTVLVGAAWIVVSSLVLFALYQRVLMINIVNPSKPPEALIDRAQDAVQRLGYGDDVQSTAAGLTTSLDWARYVDRTFTGAGRWNRLRTARPETYVLWYRTSPRTLTPFGQENKIQSLNPPLNVSGMTLVVVDSAGRLAELLAVPQPRAPDKPAPPFTNWSLMFELAGLSMADFTPATPRWVPPIHAEQRMAWEGRIAEVPDATVRVEAGATDGRPVMFAITGSWSQSSRTPGRPPASLFVRVIDSLAGLVMPLLMLVGPVLAYRNVKLGRGDRRGAFRAASAVFFLILGAWVLGDTHVPSFGVEQARLFTAIGNALFNAGLLWLTYLGLEPYVRRFSPDSLVGWTRLVAGNWRDPRVGRDVLIGISAGLAMTVVFGIHNLLPPLLGLPEPMPVAGYADQLMSIRFVLAQILHLAQNAITSGMLGMGGFVALRILLKRRWAAAVAATICFVWVVLEGLFSPGIPALDFIMGLVITAIFVAVIGWAGLLATVVTVMTHFLLLRAPLTTDLGSWRATAGLVYLAVVLAIGFGACYLAARSAPRATPRFS
jgi:predicted Ser/Thr protein kinase